MKAIYDYILSMAPYMLISLPAIFIVRFIMIKIQRNRYKTTFLHEVGLCIFILFIIGLASQAIRPAYGFMMPALHRINIIPFKVIIDTYRNVFIHGIPTSLIINFLGNIVMFMPFGFFIPLLWDKISLKKVMVIGFLSSLTIEVIQLFLGRRTDIDDLWLNVLGAVAGYGIFMIFRKICKAEKFKCRKVV